MAGLYLVYVQRRAISKFTESYLVWKLPLEKYGLKPDHSFVEDYASCQMAILPENFFSEADKGKIQFKRASKWWFWSDGIEFDDQTKLEADVVILATGFDGKKKLQSILPEPFRSLVVDSSGVMPLYRSVDFACSPGAGSVTCIGKVENLSICILIFSPVHFRGTIHPLIPNVAFVGYIESVSNLHTSELRSQWLASLVDDRFKLPKIDGMLEQIDREMEVMKRTTRFYKRHCISTFSINHSDEMCEEMGLNPWRKKNLFLEAFSPYSSMDYAGDQDEHQDPREKNTDP